MGSNKKGKKNAIRRNAVRGRSKRVSQERASAPTPPVAQEDQSSQIGGAVQVVLDNTIPGGFRMEPVCR